jgi:putative peptidoglycan lipid II flippase
VKQSLLAATLMTIGGNILGRLFGFAREAVIAGHFGTSAILDTFILAFTVPELIGMILYNALPAALIPSLGDSEADRAQHESRLFWSGLLWFALVFAAVSVLLFLLRDQVLTWVASSLSPQQSALGSRLAGILAFYVFFRGLETYFRSWCFARKHFLAPATSNIIINVAVISSVFLLFDRLNIETLAWGWLAGSALLMVYNGIFAFRLVKPVWRFDTANPWFGTLLRSLIGISVLELFTLVYLLVDRTLAAEYLGPGPISALRYASTLTALPTGIFVAAFNVASFPWISDLSGPGQADKLRTMYQQSVRMLFFFISLAAVGVILFSTDIVRVALQRGQFDQESLLLTTGPLVYLAIGMVFQAVYTFQMRFYYVRRALFRLGVILFTMLVVKVTLSWALIGSMQHEGLALATSTARCVGFVLMTADLVRYLEVDWRRLFGAFAVKTLICLALVSLLWLGAQRVWPADGYSLLGVFSRLSAMGLLGGAAYLGLGYWLRMAEPTRAVELLTSRFRK